MGMKRFNDGAGSIFGKSRWFICLFEGLRGIIESMFSLSFLIFGNYSGTNVLTIIQILSD